jgi:ketosteroid isomerase-like protein
VEDDMTPASVVPGWLAEAFDALVVGDVDGWAAIYAPDAVHELPFAPDGERRLVGREAIAARLREVFDADRGRLRFGSFDNVRLRETGDEIIIEGDGHHFRVADGEPVEISCVWFITRQDGLVTYFRDYMNPRTLAANQLM